MQAVRTALSLSFVLGAASCTPRATEGGSRPDVAPATEASGSNATLPAVELVRAGKAVPLDDAATRVLVQRVEKALAVCNFRSEKDPGVFGDADLSALWTRRESAAHLRLRYAADKTVDAVAGKLVFREVLLSVGEPYGPEPALARDARGVFGLKKCGYDDRLLGCVPELAPHFPRPDACPPGY